MSKRPLWSRDPRDEPAFLVLRPPGEPWWLFFFYPSPGMVLCIVGMIALAIWG